LHTRDRLRSAVFSKLEIGRLQRFDDTAARVRDDGVDAN